MLKSGLDLVFWHARQAVYWPGIDGNLQYHRSSCHTWDTHTPVQHPEPLILGSLPGHPFEQIVADLFQVDDKMYMAYITRLTEWLEVSHFPSGTTPGVLILS